MTTSSTYVVTLTATQLVTDALVDIGILDVDESPSANQLASGIRKLNGLLFQLKGPTSHFLPSQKPWLRESVSVTPSASSVSYSLKPSGGAANIQIPTEIISVLLRNTSAATDTPLREMTSAEYLAIPSKSETITPTRYYYEKRLSEGLLYLDGKCSSDIVSNYTLEVTYRQPLEIVTAGTQTLDLPDWWNRALEWMLAKEMGIGFTIDDATWKRVVANADESIAIAGTHDLESSVAYFQPGKDIDD